MKSFNSKTYRPNSKSSAQRKDSFFQAKLNMEKPGDRYEQEADAKTDQVLAELDNHSTKAAIAEPAIQTQREEEHQLKSKEDQSKLESKSEQPIAETVTPVVQQQAEEDQIQEKEEEELQKKEEEEVQKKEEIGSGEGEDPGEEETNVQMNGGDENQVSPSLEQNIQQSSGGQHMDSEVKGNMESGFGADFSGVNIHTDSNAVKMNQEIGAKAFTHGNDIYFNEGQYQPNTSSGQHLLAHELTHTIQQGSSPAVQGKMVQKEDNEDTETFPDSTEKYNLNTSPPKIIINSLPVPPIKSDASKIPGEQLFRANNFNRSDDNDPAHLIKWKNEVDSSGVKSKMESLGFEPNHNYVVRHYRKAKSLRIGDTNILSNRLLLPYWNQAGDYTEFDVDHYVELQIAGWPKSSWGNNLTNYWLLNSDANQASGRKILSSIRNNTANQVKNDENSKEALKSLDIDVDRLRTNTNIYNAIKGRFDIYFNSLSGSSEYAVGDSHSWPQRKILSGDHIDTLMEGRANNKGARESKSIKVYDLEDPQPQASKPFNDHDDKVNSEILGSSSEIKIFRDSFGASPFNITWDTEENTLNLESGGSAFVNLRRGIKGIVSPTQVQFDRENLNSNAGHITVNLKQFDGAVKPEVRQGLIWPIHRLPGAQFAGYLELNDLMTAINEAQPNVTIFSPANVQNIGFDPEKGIVAGGEIASNLPIFDQLDLQYSMEEGDFKIYRVFTKGDFNFPSPFEIDEVTLILSVGTRSGIGISGQVNFGIDQVGEGHIGAAASTSRGFELEGAFNFDSDLFDPAEINVEYKDNIWTIGGEIGIPEGKVRGVKSATINASYSENNFTATGEAELDVPGIERGNMTVEYGEEGFAISGDFDISSDVPGISGGNVEARVAKPAGEEEYDVFVSGTAQPDIPGIDTSLTVTYDNGALTIEGSASYKRGMLSGTVNVGATNRPIGDDGEPEGEPDDTVRVYGGGSLTLQLTPWLAATAGVNFLPNGEIEVTARLESDSYEVFPRKEINKNLFTVPTIEIPLFAIPLGPRSIGLVAQIGGGLDFTAGFGPGELRNLSAEITYNPEREEETTLSGHGEFVIPADAGLTLRGDLSLGVSVTIASLTGGIELAGTLGLEGEAAAEVDVNWSPQTGITLDAEGRVTVNPQFTFDINAFARASLGIGWFSISETWRHNLASYEWGPGIEFGVVFPIHYQEGEPFDMSFDDIEVIYPDLDVVDMAKDLAGDIKNDLFD
ncbi:DUF4157 domain-containing protein [Echinicola jeungdonensis]|uniref:DUF4157 domain-containing protein n=1 Tax=Echinicola jeungdonensis TaxID=709343 RepID=A0ABV5J8P0_9BACT|nr:DUF4157 domain-containing protein [Echinicola jeungdonensis]MDN3670810.1 DUF4157 domain-containing protein [Echinicola jeungdonensis]